MIRDGNVAISMTACGFRHLFERRAAVGIELQGGEKLAASLRKEPGLGSLDQPLGEHGGFPIEAVAPTVLHLLDVPVPAWSAAAFAAGALLALPGALGMTAALADLLLVALVAASVLASACGGVLGRDNAARYISYSLEDSMHNAVIAPLPKRALAVSICFAILPSLASAQLEEIVVTAERRATNLQQTAISASVMSDLDLLNRKAISIASLADGSIPSLRVSPFATRTSALAIGIRGIGAAAQASDIEQRVLNINDTFTFSVYNNQ